MKAFTLSKKSWHYRLATVYGNHYKYDDDTDLCSYLTSFARGLFLYLLILIVSSLMIGVLFGEAGAWLVYLLSNGFIDPTPPAVAGVALIGVAMFIIGLFFILETDEGLSIRTTVGKTVGKIIPAKDSFMRLAYRSFKEKTCVRLTLQ